MNVASLLANATAVTGGEATMVEMAIVTGSDVGTAVAGAVAVMSVIFGLPVSSACFFTIFDGFTVCMYVCMCTRGKGIRCRWGTCVG